MEVLIALALIPFAIWGLFIIAGLVWIVLPYLIMLIGLSLGYFLSQGGDHQQAALVSGLVGAIGGVWVWSRWND